MANEEGVKIVITAEDRFTETMKKIEASSKIFGETTKNTQKHLEALEREMVRLVANGLDPADKKIKEMKANYDKLNQSLNSGDSSLKKSNQQWTNLALVVQDLPYGFRGIQNNLPALMGNIAGIAGPLYLVGSAVIALFTAWDAGLFKVKNSTNILKDAQKDYNETLKSSMGSAGEEISKVKALVSIASDQELSMNKRLSAVKNLQDEYPSYFGNLDKEKILNGDVSTAVDGVKTSIIERAKATAIASKINKLSAEKFAKDEELYQLALQKTARIQAAVNFVKAFPSSAKNLKGLIDASIGGIRDQENAIKSTVDVIDKELNRLEGLYTKAKSNFINLDDTKGKKSTLNQDNSLLKSLKAEEQLYKDDMFMKRAIGLEIVNEEERLAVEKAKFEKASDKELLNIADEYKFKRLAIEKETKDGIQEINNVYADERAKAQAKADKEAFDLAKAAKNRELQNALDAIKIESDTRQKLHKKDRALLEKDLIAERDRLLELAADGIYTAEQFDKITDAMKRVDAQLAGLGSGWAETMTAIDGIIKNFINDSLFALGDSIGKALMGENINALDAFGTLLADAMQALGKQLIAYGTLKLAALKALETTTPMGAMLAIAAGIAAVAAGAALKSSLKQSGTSSINSGASSNAPRKFANGGIISGPTYGLMGEYPGAKSNPEVVAPLDKLKDLMGGGNGGTFLLRGQDLLLSVNRAQKASNLKGQSISLA